MQLVDESIRTARATLENDEASRAESLNPVRETAIDRLARLDDPSQLDGILGDARTRVLERKVDPGPKVR
jgi:hypothetical protein